MLTECVSKCVSNTVTDSSLSLYINIAMALIAFVSAACAFLTYNHQKNRSKKAEACNLAAHYANVILDKNAFIISVFKNTGLDEYISSNISMGDIQSFDRSEMIGLLDQKGITYEGFMEKVWNVDPFVILNCKIARKEMLLDRDIIMADHMVVDDVTGERQLRNEELLMSDFRQEIGELLNLLEWFGMNFRYGIADEELLYQSLHKTYLSMVWMLYPFISYQNTTNEDKLFTNVVWLFDKWRKRLKQILDEAERKKRAHDRKAEKTRARADRAQRKADREREKAEEEKEKAKSVKPKIHKGQKV